MKLCSQLIMQPVKHDGGIITKLIVLAAGLLNKSGCGYIHIYYMQSSRECSQESGKYF